MPIVKFKGQTHKFPEGATEEQIRAALSSTLTSDGVGKPDFDPEGYVQLGQLGDESQELIDYLDGGGNKPRLSTEEVELDPKQLAFAQNIAQLETGGLDNKFARTTVKGSSSSAYGRYQITRGLVRNYLKNNRAIFTDEELAALNKLEELQTVALKVGGKDRAAYAHGGINEMQGELYAEQYGYESVNDFLNAFDYGGDYGKSKDVRFKFLIDNASKKMLIDHLKRAPDTETAAARWHGGDGWETSKHKKKTKAYIDKYKKLTAEDEKAPK